MRPTPTRARQRFPQFGTFGVGVVLCGMIGAWLVHTTEWQAESVGIPVHALRLGVQTSAFDPWTQALVIRVDDRHHYLLNSKPISLQEIPPALLQHFKMRANWTVYIKGDPNADYSDVVQAADAIRAAHGRVVLLTSSAK